MDFNILLFVVIIGKSADGQQLISSCVHCAILLNMVGHNSDCTAPHDVAMAGYPTPVTVFVV